MLRIAVDAMGGDGGVEVTVAAAIAMRHRADIVLVGDEARIAPLLAATPDHASRGGGGCAADLAVVHAGDEICSGDALSDVLRHRPDTSMRRALLLQAEGAVDGVVSAGDTGALMALSRLVLRMLPGVERPAICKVIQGMEGPFWMLDLGANLACSAEQLAQFAGMGAILSRYSGGVTAPRVALLNVGTEAHKGPLVLREAAKLLENQPDLDYVGFIEGNCLFDGVADVVVCDGFVGNIALKSIEGAARMAGHLTSRALRSLTALQRAGMALSRSRLSSLREEFNPQRYNGASFVGLDGVVVKSHGGANVEGFSFAIEQAVAEAQAQIPRRLGDQFCTGAEAAADGRDDGLAENENITSEGEGPISGGGC